MQELNKINKELKSYVNQANFISQKTRNKLIKMLGEEFEIDLPLENFANIDVQLTEDGSIIMRGDTYDAPNELSEEEIEKRYENFKEKADRLINKKEVSYNNKNNFNNILNLIVLALVLIIVIILVYETIVAIFSGNYFFCIWIPFYIASWIFPNIRKMWIIDNINKRIEQAKIFLKRKFKKTKRK